MNNYNFTLVYKVKENVDVQNLLDNLESNGCIDAFSTYNDKSNLSLNFNLEASSFSQAVNQARDSVSTVAKEAEFKELIIIEDE